MIAALILAAGQSRRMGRPKMPLPWGDSTVLGHVIQVLRAAGVRDVLVVTGGNNAAAEDIAHGCDAQTVFNPGYADEEMLSSLQVGLRALSEETPAALIALGDQPQIQEETVRRIRDEYMRISAPLIVPSHRMRRGHPWLVARELWDAVFAMRSPQTPRDFLNLHASEIHYIVMDTPSILQDLDTPEDYRQFKDSD